MPRNNGNFPVWMRINAWREIFTRIFEDIETEVNVSPEWLVNPATNRRLKLDLRYPEVGVAVRFEGLQGKQRRQRPSLEEEIQQNTRDNARIELCRAHGIELIAFNAVADTPKSVFQMIDRALGQAGQRADNRNTLQKIKQARATASKLAYQMHRSDSNLKLYAELWEDRQYNEIPEPAQTAASAEKPVSFTPGMEVEHTTFGPGVIVKVTSSDDDTLLTVDFVTAGQKMLAASLVGDKLVPRQT